MTHKHSYALSHTHTHTHAHTLSHAHIAAFPQKERNAQRISGVGLVLERPEGSALLIVKGLTKDGIAELDGRISVNDTLLKVWGVSASFDKIYGSFGKIYGSFGKIWGSFDKI